MTSRKIYLCRFVPKDGLGGIPFFSCQYHFGTNLYMGLEDGKAREKRMEKLGPADNELCEYCAGEHYNEQFGKSRKRARSMMASLSDHQAHEEEG